MLMSGSASTALSLKSSLPFRNNSSGHWSGQGATLCLKMLIPIISSPSTLSATTPISDMASTHSLPLSDSGSTSNCSCQIRSSCSAADLLPGSKACSGKTTVFFSYKSASSAVISSGRGTRRSSANYLLNNSAG